MDMDTSLILIAIFVLFVCLIATVAGLVAYCGVFENVEVGAGNPPIGKVVIAYKFARGSYKAVGPVFFEVAKLAPDNKALGIFYDDPDKLEAHRLRYAVGSILAEGEQEVDKELQKKFEAEGYKIRTLPQVEHAVYSSFPYKSTFSIFIGAQKVYPRLNKYIGEHELSAYPFLEIYDGQTIKFMAPLDKQGEFYVPESLEQFPGEEPYESAFPHDVNQDSCPDAGDSPPAVTEVEDEPSLLHPSQVVRASLGNETETASEPGNEERESTGISGETQGEQGSDAESSASSFEDLKTEAEEAACQVPAPQSQ